jgi:hypothetical protein
VLLLELLTYEALCLCDHQKHDKATVRLQYNRVYMSVHLSNIRSAVSISRSILRGNSVVRSITGDM